MEFKEAYELPIGDHVEKKGKFSYLSWVYAVKSLRENMPAATWIIHENTEGLPVFSLPSGAMVKVSVVVEDKYFTQWHPVLNHQNKPINEPNSFEINTSIQRCLTKAIGLATGIGLGLYAGEDLPVDAPVDNTDAVVALENEADLNCRSVRKLGQWYAKKKQQISQLSTAHQKQINIYVSNLKAVLEEKSDFCPNSKTAPSPEKCESCDKKAECTDKPKV